MKNSILALIAFVFISNTKEFGVIDPGMTMDAKSIQNASLDASQLGGDEVNSGFDTERWLPSNNPDANKLDYHKGWPFTLPSASTQTHRAWKPQVDGQKRLPDMPEYTGQYVDGWGNKITIWAAANPGTFSVEDPYNGDGRNTLYFFVGQLTSVEVKYL